MEKDGRVPQNFTQVRVTLAYHTFSQVTVKMKLQRNDPHTW